MPSVEIAQRCLDEDFSGLTEKAEEGILKKLEALKVNPELGKPLTHEFVGLRRITYGQHRIVYRYHQQSDTVFVLLVALRKGGDIDDVYSMMHRLLQAGKLEGAVAQIEVAQKMNRQLLEGCPEERPAQEGGEADPEVVRPCYE